MRILNEQGVEITRTEIDYQLGYIKPDKLFVQYHEATEEQEEIYHYEVKTFYFDDGSKMMIESKDDPHVKVIDDQIGKFEYVDQGEGKTFRGADVHKVIDQEKVEAKEAYEEFEDIERYILFTEEELAEREAQRIEAERRENFLSFGPNRLDETETNLNDIILLMAEMIGA